MRQLHLRLKRFPWAMAISWTIFSLGIIYTVYVATHRRSGFTGMDASHLQALRIEINQSTKASQTETP